VRSNNTADTPVHDTTMSDESQVLWKQIINHISALSCREELDQLLAQPADGKQHEFLKQNVVNIILDIHQTMFQPINSYQWKTQST